MGFVFVGEHTLLGRHAAIKTLQPKMSANHEIAERFFNEARAISAISDPGVIQIFDFGYHVDGTAYIVMELLEGETLATRIDRLGRLPIGDALRIARQIASSLAAAHARDIVHRDLKPENVFLVRDSETKGGERTKILDFGICKVATKRAALTQSGTMIGTPVYMSPEQCRGAGDVDHRSDIYAFGCLMFHMLTGRPPFIGEAPGELIAAHLREAPPPASRYVSELPAVVDAVLTRCLAKSPADRFASMIELQEVIGDLCTQADASWPVGAAALPPLAAGSHAGTGVAAEIVAWRGGNASSPTHPLWPRLQSAPHADPAPTRAQSPAPMRAQSPAPMRAQSPALSMTPEPPRRLSIPMPTLGGPPPPLPPPEVLCDEVTPLPVVTAAPRDWFPPPPVVVAPRDRFTPPLAMTAVPRRQLSAGFHPAELEEATVKRPRPSTAARQQSTPGRRSRPEPPAPRDGFTPPLAMTVVPSEQRPLLPSAWYRLADVEEATIKRPRPSTAARQWAAAGNQGRVRRSRWAALANLLVLGSVLGVLATSLDDGGATAAIPASAAGAAADAVIGAAAAVEPSTSATSLPAATPITAEPIRPREQDLVEVTPLQPGETATDTATDNNAAGASPAATDDQHASPAAELSAPARDASHRSKKSMAKPRAQMPPLRPAPPRTQRQ